MAEATYSLNPFLGNINPGTTEGAKLYNKAIEAPKELLTITQKNATEIRDHFEKDARDFGWGPLIGNITIDAADTTKSILVNAREITLEDVQKAARLTWDQTTAWNVALADSFDVRAIDPATHNAQRPQFHNRVKSAMIAKRIERSLDKNSLKSLTIHKAKYEWKETNGIINNDGPTMLYLLLTKINPSVRVGISTLKTNLATATLPKFSHNVDQLFDFMETQYKEIKSKGGRHDDYTLNIFNALETTNNNEFKRYVAGQKDKWETTNLGIDDEILAEGIQEKMLSKYNNMKLAKTWKKSEDPHSKVITALATQVQTLQNQLKGKSNSQANATTSGSDNKLKNKSDKEKALGFPEWRTKKGKDEVKRDGKTYWWCPHHKREGYFDGLYMPHKPEDHDAWAENKKKWQEKRKTKKGNEKGKSNSLGLTEALKSALMTEGNMSEEQAKACWAACQQGN